MSCCAVRWKRRSGEWSPDVNPSSAVTWYQSFAITVKRLRRWSLRTLCAGSLLPPFLLCQLHLLHRLAVPTPPGAPEAVPQCFPTCLLPLLPPAGPQVTSVALPDPLAPPTAQRLSLLLPPTGGRPRSAPPALQHHLCPWRLPQLCHFMGAECLVGEAHLNAVQFLPHNEPQVRLVRDWLGCVMRQWLRPPNAIQCSIKSCLTSLIHDCLVCGLIY